MKWELTTTCKDLMDRTFNFLLDQDRSAQLWLCILQGSIHPQPFLLLIWARHSDAFPLVLFPSLSINPRYCSVQKGKKIIGVAVLNLTAGIIWPYFLLHARHAGYSNKKVIMAVFTSLIKTRTGAINSHWNNGWKRLKMSGCAPPFCTLIPPLIIMTSATASFTLCGIFHPLHYVSLFIFMLCAISCTCTLNSILSLKSDI